MIYSKIAIEALVDYLKILREEIVASCKALKKQDFESLNVSLLRVRTALYYIEEQASTPRCEFKGSEDRYEDRDDDGSYADSGAVE